METDSLQPPGSLRSWKAIARYLGRSERTVRRWEAQEGLPVRRHLHRRGSSVYALTEDLDAWTRDRSADSASARTDEVEAAATLPVPAPDSPSDLADDGTPTISVNPQQSGTPDSPQTGQAPEIAPARVDLGRLNLTRSRRPSTAAAAAGAALVAVALIGFFLANPWTREHSLEDPAAEVQRLASANYMAALPLIAQKRDAAAMVLLNEAVNIDPSFGLARAELAWLNYQRGHAQLAWRLSSEAVEALRAEATTGSRPLPRPEQMFVAATRQFVSGDYAGAEATLEALISLMPESVHFRSRLLDACNASRGRGGCAEQWTTQARARPDDLRAAYDAARALAEAGAERAAVDRWLDAATGLLSGHTILRDPGLAAEVVLFESRRAWSEGDAETSLESLREVAGTFERWPRGGRDSLAVAIAEQHTALGRLRDAAVWLARVESESLRHEAGALVHLARHDLGGLRRHLQAGTRYQSAITPMLLSMSGEQLAASDLVDRIGQRSDVEPQLDVLRARLVLSTGQPDPAVSLLETGLGTHRALDANVRLLGTDMLRDTLTQKGATAEALRVAHMYSPTRTGAALEGAGAVWLLCQSRLAGLYETLGRPADAERILEEVRLRLEYADTGHPLTAASS